MLRRFSSSLVCPLLSCLILAWATSACAQDPPMSVNAKEQDPRDRKVDPLLLADAQQLAETGVVRDGDQRRATMRVIIAITKQTGDVTLETSTAIDPVLDVQAAVINRQAKFVDSLDDILQNARAGVRILFSLDLQYMIVAEVSDLPTLRALACAVGVDYVWKDGTVKHQTNEGRALTGSAAAAAVGFTGAGVGVAVVDSFFDLMHSELGGSTFLPNSVIKAAYNSVTNNTAVNSQAASDCDHATSVVSIVRRYAPAAHVYAVTAFPAGSTTTNISNVINAINWCIFNRGGAGAGAPIRVINLSLGGGQYFGPITSLLDPVHRVCTDALLSGILCVAAAGNDGWTNSLSNFAASASSISVGASWDANLPAYSGSCTDPNPQVDERACFSNTAWFLSFYCPSWRATCAKCAGTNWYFDGTSASAPAASGLIAQFLHARPHYVGDRASLISIFQATGDPVTGDPTLATPRRVRVSAAITASTFANGLQMHLYAPPVIGQVSQFGMSYPISAAGNPYLLLWALQWPGTVQIAVPGLTVLGTLRVDPASALPAFSGVLDWTGLVVHSVAVPNQTSLMGYAWDVQGLAISSSHVVLADNELALSVTGTVPTTMVPIAPGTFQMGSNAGPPDGVAPYFPSFFERPVHVVSITRPFWIGKYEVTQQEFQGIMGYNPSFHQGPAWPNSSSRPVEGVSWNEALAYCAALTAQEAAAGRLPSGYQYRLPTEAEWEYCCRAGTNTEFCYGSSLTCGQARFQSSLHTGATCVPNGTAVVGQYTPNAWGLFDMHGNVAEWCLDRPGGLSTFYPAGPVFDPYASDGTSLVARGGNAYSNSSYCRSANRLWYSGPPFWPGDGFRVVLAPVLVP